jgi:hypothetical protein
MTATAAHRIDKGEGGNHMSHDPTGRSSQLFAPDRYEIRIAEHLARRWATWFDGMTLIPQDDGTTVISGPVADQSALHGLLRKVSDLGLTLVSVTPAVAEAAAATPPIAPDRTVQGPTPTRSST